MVAYIDHLGAILNIQHNWEDLPNHLKREEKICIFASQFSIMNHEVTTNSRIHNFLFSRFVLYIY